MTRFATSIDADAVNPDSLRAVLSYAVDGLYRKAEEFRLCLDFNTIRIETENDGGDFRVIASAEVLP